MERVKNTISLVSPAFLQGRPKLSLRFGRLDFVSLLDSTFSALAFQSSKIIGIFFFFLLEDKEEYLEISDQIANFAELFPRAVCNGPGNKSALEQSASHLQLLLLLFFLLLLLYFLPASVRGIWQEEDFCGHDMETRVRDPEQQQEQQQKQNAQMWIFFGGSRTNKINQIPPRLVSSFRCFFPPLNVEVSWLLPIYIYVFINFVRVAEIVYISNRDKYLLLWKRLRLKLLLVFTRIRATIKDSGSIYLFIGLRLIVSVFNIYQVRRVSFISSFFLSSMCSQGMIWRRILTRE